MSNDSTTQSTRTYADEMAAGKSSEQIVREDRDQWDKQTQTTDNPLLAGAVFSPDRMTIDEMARALDRSPAEVWRALQNLVAKGLVKGSVNHMSDPKTTVYVLVFFLAT